MLSREEYSTAKQAGLLVGEDLIGVSRFTAEQLKVFHYWKRRRVQDGIHRPPSLEPQGPLN